MKKILTTLVLLFICPCIAINWIEVKSENGKTVQLDKDSITKYKGYYFYNVKFQKNNNQDVVITMQSQVLHPYCQRIKYYDLDDYKNLKGDYDNIANEITKNLEPVSYKSQAFAVYKKVHSLMSEKNKPQITF